jgi:hypothetical protein
MREELLLDVSRRQVVFTIPKEEELGISVSEEKLFVSTMGTHGIIKLTKCV